MGWGVLSTIACKDLGGPCPAVITRLVYPGLSGATRIHPEKIYAAPMLEETVTVDAKTVFYKGPAQSLIHRPPKGCPACAGSTLNTRQIVAIGHDEELRIRYGRDLTTLRFGRNRNGIAHQSRRVFPVKLCFGREDKRREIGGNGIDWQ
jgi:hypothetical protein